MKASEIWRNYMTAMDKRRPGSALSWEHFRSYILSPSVVYHSHGGSFIFGQVQDGIFFPSHFAPKGPKSAVELLKLMRSKAVCFAVTEDLSSMLQRLGYKRLPLRVSCDFRGTKVQKVILVSSLRIAPKVAILILKERFAQSGLKRFSERLSLVLFRISHISLKREQFVSIDEDALYKEV